MSPEEVTEYVDELLAEYPSMTVAEIVAELRHPSFDEMPEDTAAIIAELVGRLTVFRELRRAF